MARSRAGISLREGCELTLVKRPKVIAIVVCLLVFAQPSAVFLAQGPGGEVLRRPPPVDGAAAARAERATHARAKVSVKDQIELAIKRGNDSMTRGYLEGYSAAAKHYRLAIRLNPKEPRAHYALGNALYENDKFGSGGFEDAMREYQEAIRLKPNYAYALTGLGNVYSRQAKDDKAIETYQHAIQLNPRNDVAHFQLGRAPPG